MKKDLRLVILGIGLVWSGTMVTLNALGIISIKDNKEFFIGVFSGSAAGLGIKKE